MVQLTGAGALAEFDSAVNALSALIELQQAMAGANRDQPEADRIVFRAGIHLGEVLMTKEGVPGRASSFASLPELTKKQTLSVSGNVAVSFAAYSRTSSLR